MQLTQQFLEFYQFTYRFLYLSSQIYDKDDENVLDDTFRFLLKNKLSFKELYFNINPNAHILQHDNTLKNPSSINDNSNFINKNNLNFIQSNNISTKELDPNTINFTEQSQNVFKSNNFIESKNAPLNHNIDFNNNQDSQKLSQKTLQRSLQKSRSIVDEDDFIEDSNNILQKIISLKHIIFKIIFYMSSIFQIFFIKKIKICSIDLFKAISIDVRKQDVLNSHLYENFVIYQAFSQHKIDGDSAIYTLHSNIYGENITYQIYWIKNSSLLRFSKNNVFLVDVFKIFGHIYDLDRSLGHFTIVLIDVHSKALCNYSHGNLCFISIKSSDIDIENYLSEIDEIGTIFYFSFINEDFQNSDFKSINEYFHVSKIALLKILTYLHLRYNPSDLICHREFVFTRAIVKALFCVSFILIAYFSSFFVINTMKIAKYSAVHNRNMNDALQKRLQYIPMYNRIYDEIKNQKSLYINMRQKYDGKKWIAY